MYKMFALAMLVLAPMLAMIAGSFEPATDVQPAPPQPAAMAPQIVVPTAAQLAPPPPPAPPPAEATSNTPGPLVVAPMQIVPMDPKPMMPLGDSESSNTTEDHPALKE